MYIAIIIIVAIIFLVVGFILGNIFPIFAEDEEENEESEGGEKIIEDEEEDSQEIEEIDEPEPLPEPKIHPGLREIAKIWRRDITKELVAEIEETQLTKGNQLDSEQQAVLSMLLVDLQDWVGLEKRMETKKTSTRTSSQEEFHEVEDPLDQIKEGLSRYNPFVFVKKAVQAGVVPPDNLVSLSDQIDEIVQEMLEDSPLKERGIRLMEIEGRGMVFVIGLDMYDEVEDIPEEEVRVLIKSAVKEWEKRTSEV
ncbi:MAG: hypothetical protein FVQ83_11170 [Chloroflexi bacterium]|nr:hypothetical protein [Chloroflexota bacterium]